jgi:selenocysteine-specific elongation factor
VDAVHRDHPERAGLNVADLRAVLPAPVAGVVLTDLCHDGFVRSGATIRRAAFRPALPPRLQAAGAKLRKVLADRPFDPPSRKELTPDALAQQALRFLLINGEAVDVGPDVVLASEAMAKVIAAVREHIGRHGPALVSELKTALGSSRRIMVPLLEKLDRDGVTRREGDRRVLR